MSSESYTPVSPLTARPRILVPIRYPLTDESRETLKYATRLASEHGGAELFVLHVDLFQLGGRTASAELARAIAPIVGEQRASVTVCGGFIVEEVIRDEVRRLDADVVVLGRNNKPTWRRTLSRVVGNDPNIALFLDEQTDARIELRE